MTMLQPDSMQNQAPKAPSKLDDAYNVWNKDKTPENLNNLLTASNNIFNSAIKSYAGIDDPFTRANAKKLAITAFKTYDPKKNVKLQTHLYNQLQPLRRASIDRHNVLRIPERVQYERMHMQRGITELTNMYDREPTDEELADHLGVSMKRLKYIRQYNSAKAVAESTRKSPDGIGFQDATLESNPMAAWTDYVYFDLDPVSKKIFEWRTGYNGQPKLSNLEIASRLKMTPAAVTQRANKIGKKFEEGAKLWVK